MFMVTMHMVMPRRSAVAMTVHSIVARQLSLPPLALSLILLLVQRSLQGSPRPVAASTPSTENGECFLDDRCTLLSFKQSLENQGWPALASWSEIDATKWKGVTWARGTNGTSTVEKLELRGCGLSGANLYPLLQRGLPLLQVLDISENNFTGMLPATLQVCGALQVLNLSSNSFSGHLPQKLGCRSSQLENLALSPTRAPQGNGMYPNLETFNLSSNKFTGPMPENLLVALSSVQHLDVSNNQLTGSIPAQVGRLYNLRSLTLSDNHFTGSIPFRALANISSLELLELGDNLLTGRLDIGAGAGGFASLKTLNASGNALDGPIPPQIGNISSLEILALKYNNFTGRIPSALSRCSRLKSLYLQHNFLNGTIPTELSQLSGLTTLRLNRNRLSGHGQSISFLANCSSLRSMWLGENLLSGAVPPELGNMTGLVVLSLYANRFVSSIPPELGRLVNLVAFEVSFNGLNGTLPHTLCNLSRLQVLWFTSNQLSGHLLDCLWNYTSLRLLDGASNMFTGSLPSAPPGGAFAREQVPVPPELSDAVYLRANQFDRVWKYSRSPINLFLDNNYLSGEIPTSFGNFHSLQEISLSNNSLTGAIPTSLGNLTSIFLMDFSFNRLSGFIPSQLASLHSLSQLNLSFNDLRGQIPESGQFLAFPESSFLGNEGLCGVVLGKNCKQDINSSSSGPFEERSRTSYALQGNANISIPALMIGFALGFVGVEAALIFSGKARHCLFALLKLPQDNRSHNAHSQEYGLFRHTRFVRAPNHRLHR